MDFNQFNYCTEAAKYKSFSKVAERCHVSQSVVSVQIKKLEDELGIRIFKRTSSGIIPTIEGERFLSYAYEMLDVKKNMENDLQKFQASINKSLSIGLAQCTAIYKLTQCVAAYQKASPDVELSFEEGYSEELLDLLRSEKIDVAYLSGLSLPSDLQTQKIFQSEIVVVTSPDNKIGHGDVIDLDNLRNQTFIFSKDSSIYRAVRNLPEVIAAKKRNEGFFNFHITKNSHIYTNLSLVANNVGISLVTITTAKSFPGDLRIIHLKKPLSHYIYLATSGSKDNELQKNRFFKFNSTYHFQL